MAEVAYLVFTVAGVDLAVPASSVDAVTAVERATPIPGAPPHIVGLVALGDRVVPLVDLEVFLSLASTQASPVDPLFHRTLIIQSGAYEAGLLCHRARGLIGVTRSNMKSPSVLQGAGLKPFLTSELDTQRGLVGILDPKVLLEAAAVA